MAPQQLQKVQALQGDPAQQHGALLAFVFSAVGALCLSGCSMNSDYVSLAPAPPPYSGERVGGVSNGAAYYAVNHNVGQGIVGSLSDIETAAGTPVGSYDYAVALKSEPVRARGCRPQDRFDRKHLVSYQWGEQDRSALGIDIDGIGMDSMKIEAVKLEFRFRLQPIKKKVERCRYKSAWQGMVATSYHELFVREDNTVWGDLKDIQDDFSSRFDTLVGN